MREKKKRKRYALSTTCPYCGGEADFVEYDEMGRKIYYCYECDIHLTEE
jgi:Zn ribbon nucleic-acid-binding protein